MKDIFDLTSTIDSNSVDLTFADSPYNLDKKYYLYKDKKIDVEYIKWVEHWLNEMVRITKPRGSIIVVNIPMWAVKFANILNNFATMRSWITWKATTRARFKDYLIPAHYSILHYVNRHDDFKFYPVRYPHPRCRRRNTCNRIHADYGGKKDTIHPFGPLCSDVWTDIHRVMSVKKGEKYHPCQLPLHLMERIILMTTDADDIVFDGFGGTGTTGLAAQRLERNWILGEIDPKYSLLSNRRIQGDKFKSMLGDYYVSYHKNEVATIRDIDWNDLSQYFNIPKNLKELDYIDIKLRNTN